MIEIKQKSEIFKKSIRRETIENIFKTKRLVMLEEMVQLTNQSKHPVLVEVIQDIKTNVNIKENLIVLINILALEDPYKRFWRENYNPQKNLIDKFNTDLIKTLLSETLPSFNKSQQMRIYCLNAVSNLLADKNCSKAQNLDLVLQLIGSIYGSISDWGYNRETKQICFLIANSFQQNILNVGEKVIVKLLEWSSQILYFGETDCIGQLIKHLHEFFDEVDQMYNKNRFHYITQHYKNQRIYIIEQCIKRINVDFNRWQLQTLLNFLKANIQYCGLVFSFQEHIWIVMIENLVKFFGQTSQKSQSASISFLLVALRYIQYPQRQNKTNNQSIQDDEENLFQKIHRRNDCTQKMRIYLVRKHFSNILKAICWQGLSAKAMLLKLINQIMQYPQETEGKIIYRPKNNKVTVYQFLIKQGLQSVLVNLLNQIQCVDLWTQIIQIYGRLVNANSKFGMKIKKTMQRILTENNNSTALDQKMESILHFHDYSLANK